MDEKNFNEKFSIENLSESTRKKIFFISVITLSLIIIVFWVITFSETIKNTKVIPDSVEIIDIQQDFKNIIDVTQTGVSDIKEQLEELPDVPKQTTEQEQIDLLKQKILENNKSEQ